MFAECRLHLLLHGLLGCARDIGGAGGEGLQGALVQGHRLRSTFSR